MQFKNWFKSFLITLSTCLIQGGVIAQETPLELHDLVNIRQPASVEMSPDGSWLAYTLTLPPESPLSSGQADGLKELYVVSRKGLRIPMILGGDAIGQLVWSSDSKTIWFLGRRFNDTHVGIYRMSVTGGEAIKVVRYSADIKGFALHPDKPKLMFWATEHIEGSKPGTQSTATVYESKRDHDVLWELDLSQPDQQAKLKFDARHVIKAQYVPDSENIFIQAASSKLTDDVVMEKSLLVVGVNGKQVWEAEHVGKMGKAVLSPDGKKVAFIGTNDVTDTSEGRLMVATIGEKTSTNLLTDFEGHIRDIAWQTNKQVIFIAHRGVTSLLARKRINGNSTSYRRLLSPKEIMYKLSSSDDGKHVAIVADSNQHPKELFWYTQDSLRRYSNFNPWIKQRQLAEQKRIEYKARDGLELEGILVSPPAMDAKPLPTIIFVHGGPEAHVSNGWLNRYAHPAHTAALRGFRVFFPNYRGSTGRGVRFAKSGQNDYAGKEFDDIVDARAFLVEQGLTDPERVGITGASYGGYAAAWAATKHSPLFAASVSGMGIGHQTSKFGTTDIPNEMYTQHAQQWPWEDWQWMLERSPIFYAGQSKTPLLLMHGKKDYRVHYSQSMELYRFIEKQTDTPVRLVLYPDEGHGFRRAANKLDYSIRLMRWMEHFLINNETTLPPEPIQKAD